MKNERYYEQQEVRYSISRIECGLSSVKTATTANTNVNRDITFEKPFSESPIVLATVVSSNPATNRASVVMVTETGFRLVTNRTSSIQAGQGDDAYWVAIGK